MSNGMYLNVYVAGEFVNGLTKGHFFHSVDLEWSSTKQAALNILDISPSVFVNLIVTLFSIFSVILPRENEFSPSMMIGQ